MPVRCESSKENNVVHIRRAVFSSHEEIECALDGALHGKLGPRAWEDVTWRLGQSHVEVEFCNKEFAQHAVNTINANGLDGQTAEATLAGGDTHPSGSASTVSAASSAPASAVLTSAAASSGEHGAVSTLFVGQVAERVTESELRSLFAPHGALRSVSIVTDRATGRGKGFAFVEYEQRASCFRAIDALHRRELHGRRLDISIKRARQRPGGCRAHVG